MRILLIDDDETLIDILTRTLQEKSYAVDVATDGEQGWVYGSTYNYDLIILDWSLPKLDGISLCQRFRASGHDTPIILLTSRDGSQNKIRGLNAGADDYISKPFDVDELTARIRALLRRLNCDFLPVLSWGDLQLDPCSYQVIYQGQVLLLAAKEYRLLELFLRHAQEVLSIEDIIESLWSSMEYPSNATVRSHIRHLRKKLCLAGLPKDIIITVRGQGYCLKPLSQNEHINDNSQITSNPPEPQLDKHAQHLAALTSIWEKHHPKRQQQLAQLQQAITSLKTGSLEVSDRISAIVTAHSLAGNLGQFGLHQGSRLAKDIEQSLQNDPSQEQWQTLNLKLTELSQEISKERDITPQINQTILANSPLLLIVSDNSQLNSQLTQAATHQGIKTEITASPELAKTWLQKQQDNHQKLPQTVIVNLSFADSQNALRQESLELISELKLFVPSIPVIVIGDRDNFQDRLLVARHGGSFYLSQPVNPKQIITLSLQAIQCSSLGKKIMVVDDDIELLQVLPTLLEPWKFQLTTLDDPRQFWDVLQAVTPDLLILDIEMPHLSGIELCKVLRTHPYWRKLPVLFLSIYSDLTISNQVFASGANDLVNKPIIPQQLASRIINHLND
ncbi:MAG: response regulator [Xenococcaceae cyanobacterium MO_167.B52]|nr:response regulator [Xenococcaceae cyanobacterium MO_167.B52]